MEKLTVKGSGKVVCILNGIISFCFVMLMGLIVVNKFAFLFEMLPSFIAILGVVVIVVLVFCIFIFWKEIYGFFSSIFAWLDRKTTVKTALLYLTLLSLLVKIIVILFMKINSLIHPDINVYVTTASELIEIGHAHKFSEYCLDNSHMFWFACFLTPVVRLFGENSTVLSIYLAFVGTVSELFLYDTVRRNFSKKRALAIFTVFTLLPSQILLPSFVTHEQALLFFLSLSVWLIFGIFPQLYQKGKRLLSYSIFALGVLALLISIQMNMAGLVAGIALCIILIIESLKKTALKTRIKGLCIGSVKCLLIIMAVVLSMQFCSKFQYSHSDYNDDYNYVSQRKILWTLFVGSNVETNGQWSLEDTESFDAYPDDATIEERNDFQINQLSERYHDLVENRTLCHLLKAKLTTIWSHFAYPISFANETISDQTLREIYNRFLFKPLTCIEYGLSVILVIFCIAALFSLRRYTVKPFYQFVQLYLLGTTAMLMLTECTSKYTISMQPFFVIACIVMCNQELCGFFRKVHDKVSAELAKVVNRRYENRMRSSLQNDKFSIICSNCIGGIIYHRLGKKFLSPTINLWMHQSDFLKFVFDLKNYLSKDLVFIETEYDYPVALLGDVKVFFNHSETEGEAAESWNRRKNRVNYDNLFVIMYERDGITEDDIRKLSNLPCKNKIVLSDKKHPDIDYVLTMKVHDKPNGEQFLDKDDFGMRTYEKHFNYVNWLDI